MTYQFWDNFNTFLPYELQMKFDIRLCNVILKLESFLNHVMIHPIKKEQISFFWQVLVSKKIPLEILI